MSKSDHGRGAQLCAPTEDQLLALEEAVPRDVFRAEVSAWARRIGVEPKEVHIRPMSRKWGSCSTNGRVTFNTELLSKPATSRRRVIVEELLHLKVPNHGKLFKSLLRVYLAADEMLEERTKRGSRVKYEATLAQMPDIEPEAYDKLPYS